MSAKVDQNSDELLSKYNNMLGEFKCLEKKTNDYEEKFRLLEQENQELYVKIKRCLELKNKHQNKSTEHREKIIEGDKYNQREIERSYISKIYYNDKFKPKYKSSADISRERLDSNIRYEDDNYVNNYNYDRFQNNTNKNGYYDQKNNRSSNQNKVYDNTRKYNSNTICTHFSRGKCKFGDRCFKEHKIIICTHFNEGNCWYGNKCWKAHIANHY